jgi:hypothetical protein
MALNTDFKVKDSLYVGNSAYFVNQTNTATILSAGVSLFDIFLQEGEISAQCALINGTGITGLNYDGQSICTISISAACNSAWNTAYSWVNANGTNVTNTLTTLRSLSGANITCVTSPYQGTLNTTFACGTLSTMWSRSSNMVIVLPLQVLLLVILLLVLLLIIQFQLVQVTLLFNQRQVLLLYLVTHTLEEILK